MEKSILHFQGTIHAIRNGEHFNLGQALTTRILLDAPSIGNQKFTRLANNFKGDFDHEDATIKTQRKAIETPLIHDAGIAMNTHEAFAEKIVRAFAEYNGFPDKQAAAKALEPIFDNFNHLRQKGQADESGLMTNMLEDLDKPESKAALATLGLQPVVEFMRAAHKRFLDLWNDRTFSNELKVLVGKVREARKASDNSLTSLLKHIVSLYNSEVLPEQAQKTLGVLIDYINGQIHAYAEILAHRHGHKIPSRPGPIFPDVTLPSPPPDPLDPGNE